MSGKIIAITGANGGLGKALSKRFAADGDKVVLLGRTLSKVQNVADEIGESGCAIECIVTSPDSVKNAFEKISSILGKIDVLINNAAVFQSSLIEATTDAFRLIVDSPVDLSIGTITYQGRLPSDGNLLL